MSLDFLYLGLGSDHVDYRETWDLQRALHAEVVAGTAPSTVLLLEHASVYTAGKRTEPHERPLDGTPVVDVDRGGKITWHGPGQLVGYPIVRLPEAFGVVDYVRRLEEAMIATFAELGLATGRVRGRSGVWVAADPSTGSGQGVRPERKIAAIGVRVAGGVTMHGFAINVDPDLDAFDRIIPCGLTDVGVTSLAAELGDAPSLTGLAYVLRPHLERLLAFEPYEQSADLPRPDETPQVTYGLTVGAA
jgi:lipoyl(octanoyl) transferase